MGKAVIDKETHVGEAMMRCPRLFRKTKCLRAPASNSAIPRKTKCPRASAGKSAIPRKAMTNFPLWPVARTAPAAEVSSANCRRRLRKLSETVVILADKGKSGKLRNLREKSTETVVDGAEAHQRDLFGNIMRAPSKFMIRGPSADLCPWHDLEPSDVEHLSSDEVGHYEKVLQLSSKRGRPERLARLMLLAQRNTLTSGPSSLCAFMALGEEQQQAIGAVELKRLERLAFLADNEFLSLGERRDRLVELLREARSKKVVKSRSIESFLVLRSSSVGSKAADVEMAEATATQAVFVVGQRVQRRDDGEDWGIGYVVSVDPLEVTVFDTLAARGHEWCEVRHIPPEVMAAV